MRDKFEINYDYNLSKKNKHIYVENQVGGKGLQHLEPCFQFSSITFFTIIDNLFNHFENIFDNHHQKKHVIEKFRKLRMRAT